MSLARSSTALSPVSTNSTRTAPGWKRAPTPLLPAIRVLSRAGDIDTDDAATLQKRRLGLNSSSLSLRPSTGMKFGHLGVKSLSEGAFVPLAEAERLSMRSTGMNRTARSTAPSTRPSMRSTAPSGWFSSASSTSPSARRQSPPSSRGRTGGIPILEGISIPAELQNVQRECDFERLYTQFEEEGEGAEHPGAHGERNLCLESLGQNFMSDVNVTLRMITDLHDQHQDFSPGKTLRKSQPGKHSKSSRANMMGDEEEGESESDKLAERLEFFKMARKFDPEPLPPLTPAGISSRMHLMQMRASEPKPRPPELIDYNTSEEALLRFMPKEKKALLRRKKDENSIRVADVLGNRECLMQGLTDKWSEELNRKMLQAEAALMLKRRGEKLEWQKEECIQQWLTVLSACVFIQCIQAGLNKEHKSKLWKDLTVGDTIQKLEENPQAQFTFQFLALRWKGKRMICQKEKSAHAVHACLNHWRRRGQTFVLFKFFGATIRKLQAWWRRTAKELHEIRDTLAERWKVLERAELVKELAVGGTRYEQTPSPKLRMPNKKLTTTFADESHSLSSSLSTTTASQASTKRGAALTANAQSTRPNQRRHTVMPSSQAQAQKGMKRADTTDHDLMGHATNDRMGKSDSMKKNASIGYQDNHEDGLARKDRRAKTYAGEEIQEDADLHRKSGRKAHFSQDDEHDALIDSLMTPEAKRLIFIENELRARRYFLLPEIEIWQEEMKKWRETEEQRKADIKNKSKRSLAVFFRMPPVRPSYIPLPHLHAAERHHYSPCEECSKWCEGKRGDKELLKWLKMLRHFEGNTEIPPHGPAQRRHHDEKGNNGKGDGADNSQQHSLFGSVPEEEELQKYGLAFEEMGMPGLDRKGENHERVPAVYAHGGLSYDVL